MPTTIKMPELAPSMTEATLVNWLVKIGDRVSAGDPIAELETDKAMVELEATDAGTITELLVAAGTDGVAADTPLAVLSEVSSSTALETAPVPAAEATPVPETSPLPIEAEPNKKGATPKQRFNGGSVNASPLARRMAAQAGIDLTAIAGSGPDGRVVKRDIDSMLSSAGAEHTTVAARTPAASLPDEPISASHTLVPHTAMRRTIAERLSAAKTHIPHFYMSIDCNIDALLAMRAELNVLGTAEEKVSVNDIVIKAAAAALKRVPQANASWTDDGIARHESIDISVAVSIPDGLITPVIRNADKKGLRDIATETKDLAARARARTLKPDEYRGGTFSLSNLGMHGIKEFAAIINPPQGAILAVGAGEERPVVRNHELSVATVMTCTLSADHRVVDGAVGAEFIKTFRSMIEHPLDILL